MDVTLVFLVGVTLAFLPSLDTPLHPWRTPPGGLIFAEDFHIGRDSIKLSPVREPTGTCIISSLNPRGVLGAFGQTNDAAHGSTFQGVNVGIIYARNPTSEFDGTLLEGTVAFNESYAIRCTFHSSAATHGVHELDFGMRNGAVTFGYNTVTDKATHGAREKDIDVRNATVVSGDNTAIYGGCLLFYQMFAMQRPLYSSAATHGVREKDIDVRNATVVSGDNTVVYGGDNLHTASSMESAFYVSGGNWTTSTIFGGFYPNASYMTGSGLASGAIFVSSNGGAALRMQAPGDGDNRVHFHPCVVVTTDGGYIRNSSSMDGIVSASDAHHRGLEAKERTTRWTCLAVGMGGMLVTSGIVLVWLVGGARQAGDEEANHGFRRLWTLSLSLFDDVWQNECPHSAMKTAVVVWQTVTQVSAVAKTGYTNRYTTFISSISFANMDVGSIIFCPCAFHLGFYQNLLWATTWPIVVLVILGGVYGWVARRSIPCRHALAVVRFRLVSTAFLVLFFVYASVTLTIFQTFVCDIGVFGEHHLRADHALICFTPLHRVYVTYASVMVAIYPIGVPVLFIVWRIRTRHDMDPEGTEQNMGGIQHRSNIYTVCRPALFNYDAIECARRALLAACLTFGESGGRLQVTVLLLNTFVPLFVESLYSFRSQFETFIYRWGNNIVISSSFVALLVNASGSSDDTLVVPALCDVLIVANLFMIVAVVIEFLISVAKLLVCHIYPGNLGEAGWPSGTNERGIDAVL